jgi:hypothetical protein
MRRVSPTLALLALAAACDAGPSEPLGLAPDAGPTVALDAGELPPGAPDAGPQVRPDFRLVDVSTTSPRAGEAVSPRDYLEKVSGWYFTHAT